MYTVYVLRNPRTGKFYTGYSSDLTKRLKQHLSGKTRSLRGRGSFQIVYTENFPTRSEAYKRERQIKSYKGGEALHKMLGSPPPAAGSR
ncbi:MAG: GIY-YIG nuclease family protein [Patescibacteria group bacterium]